MKLFICGPARHGKDTVAEILGNQFKHESSSHFCMRHFLRDALAAQYGLTYETEEECFEDRVNHRKAWFDLITEYNMRDGDRARLSRELFAEYDIYVGIRNRFEFLAAREEGLVDLAVFVHAGDRLPDQPIHPNPITASDCDLTILNDRSIEELRVKVCRLFGLFSQIGLSRL